MHNRTTLQGKHASQSHCGEEKNVFFYFSFLFNFLILFFVKHCLRIGKKEIKNQKQVNDMIFAFANYMENNSEKLKRNKMKIKWSSEKTNVMRMRNENPFFLFLHANRLWMWICHASINNNKKNKNNKKTWLKWNEIRFFFCFFYFNFHFNV